MPGHKTRRNDVERGDFAGGNAGRDPDFALDGEDADLIPPDWEIHVLKLVGLGIVTIVVHNVLKLLLGQSHF
jgi:hypothetical protein